MHHLEAFGWMNLEAPGSSFPFMPVRNDLLLVALTAQFGAPADEVITKAAIEVTSFRDGRNGLERLGPKR